jgi:hypothetical protein
MVSFLNWLRSAQWDLWLGLIWSNILESIAMPLSSAYSSDSNIYSQQNIKVDRRRPAVCTRRRFERGKNINGLIKRWKPDITVV